MSLNWNSRIDLSDQNIVYHQKNVSSSAPRVTIGLPTYRRDQLLPRALASVASQTYRNFILIISDNYGYNPCTLSAVDKYSSSLPEVLVIAQAYNIGALENLKFLLAATKTEYFMWLADDDEISSGYLQELIYLLDNDSSIVTSMGNWIAMVDPYLGQKRRQLRPVETDILGRLFRFVLGPADDSAFYGLHRTECLRRASFTDYLPPNRGVLTNFCYLILFDLLLQGRFEYANNANWICHNYSSKEYHKSRSSSLLDRIRTILRRFNVYTLYVIKSARSNILLSPFVLAASIIGFLCDLGFALRRLILSSLQ